MLFGAKRAARWIHRRLKGGAGRSSEPYWPDFSGTALGSGKAESEEQSRAALRRRARFGRHFFVAPDTIQSLWQQFAEQFPDQAQRQIETTNADMRVGIPIYNTTGPRLGSGFPWSSLPVGPGSDAIFAKRPHRFAFAPRSALACLYDPAAAHRLSGMLDSWMQCAATGESRFCYDSNLGVIQRILALSWCWTFLTARDPESGSEGMDPEWRVLAIIRADIGFLEPRLGQSTPNNHLLADWFAGWYLQQVFPEFLEQSEVDYESRWCDELLRQTYPDGGSFEHSVHYHEFACEMGVAYLLLCRRGGKVPNPEVKERVEALLHFQAALAGSEAIPLPIGNGIEDTLFPLDTGEGWCPGSLRELYRALFRPEVSPSPLDNISVVRAFWLLGGKLAPLPASTTPTNPADQEREGIDTFSSLNRLTVGTQAFPDSGLYIQSDPELNARLGFRTGPRMGLPVAVGHMHADFLSIYLSMGGHPILVDAGTYTYRSPARRWEPGSPGWRPYFAGPAAHNTFAIDGHDPLGELRGDFRRSTTKVHVSSEHRSATRLDMVDARLLGGGVYEGTRRICIHVRGRYWLIIDYPPQHASASEAAWYGFQFASGSEVSVDGRKATVRYSADSPAMTLLASTGLDEPTKLEGSLKPLGGWVSPRYGERVAAPQLRFGIRPGDGPSAFLLGVGAVPFASLVIAETREGATLIRARSSDHEDILLLDSRTDAEQPIECGGMLFAGRLCWIRMTAGRPTVLGWLDSRRFSWDEYRLDLDLEHSDSQEVSFDVTAVERPP